MSVENTHKELHALVSLLDEPSDDIYLQIRTKLVNYGSDAIPFLEDVWDNSFNEIVQERSEAIIHAIQFKALRFDLIDWIKNEPENLLRGLYILSKFNYPGLRFEELSQSVEALYRDIWLELNENLTALEKVKVFNHIFYDIHQFKSNRRNLNDPNNLYLKHLLDSKKGIHLSLGSLYIVLAQKLNLPVLGVDLPHYFILAYMDPVDDHENKKLDKENILFYINPFFKGSVFTKNEIEAYLDQMKLKPEDKYFLPTSAPNIIYRSMEMLQIIYKKIRKSEKVEELSVMMDLLTDYK